MADNLFQVSILASDHVFYIGPCESLIVPTVDGFYGIKAHHTNMVTEIVQGKMTYRLPGEENRIAAVSSGIVKVEANEVLVLVNTIERPEEIDENRAKREAEEAKEQMLQKRSIQEYRSAQAHLARALNRLKVKGLRYY